MYSHQNTISIAIDSSHAMFLNACVIYDPVSSDFFLYLQTNQKFIFGMIFQFA